MTVTICVQSCLISQKKIMKNFFINDFSIFAANISWLRDESDPSLFAQRHFFCTGWYRTAVPKTVANQIDIGVKSTLEWKHPLSVLC